MKITILNKTKKNLMWPLSKVKSIYREKEGKPVKIEVEKLLIPLFKKDHTKLFKENEEYQNLIKDKLLIIDFIKEETTKEDNKKNKTTGVNQIIEEKE